MLDTYLEWNGILLSWWKLLILFISQCSFARRWQRTRDGWCSRESTVLWTSDILEKSQSIYMESVQLWEGSKVEVQFGGKQRRKGQNLWDGKCYSGRENWNWRGMGSFLGVSLSIVPLQLSSLNGNKIYDRASKYMTLLFVLCLYFLWTF